MGDLPHRKTQKNCPTERDIVVILIFKKTDIFDI